MPIWANQHSQELLDMVKEESSSSLDTKSPLGSMLTARGLVIMPAISRSRLPHNRYWRKTNWLCDCMVDLEETPGLWPAIAKGKLEGKLHRKTTYPSDVSQQSTSVESPWTVPVNHASGSRKSR